MIYQHELIEKCAPVDNIIEKTNYQLITEFISNNINYFLWLMILLLTAIFYFLNKKFKNAWKTKNKNI